MSISRLVVLAVTSALAFLVGFYVGIFVLLSIVDFAALQGWQFTVATVPTGGLLAAAAAALVTPRPDTATPAAAVIAAVVATAGLLLVDGDFVVAIGVGCLLVVGSIAVTAARSRPGP